MAEKNWSEELTAYIDGELRPDEVQALEAQLARDPALQALEQTLRRTISAVEALPQPATAPPFALRSKVLAAVQAEVAPAPSLGARLLGWLTPPRLGLALAAAVAAVVVWPRRPEPLSEEDLLLSLHLDEVENLDLVGLASAEDLDVVASLHELEGVQ